MCRTQSRWCWSINSWFWSQSRSRCLWTFSPLGLSSAQKMNPFTSLKEKGLAMAVKAMINREIEKCGEVTELAIDTREKTLRVELALKGETSPIEINVGAYEVSEKGGKVFLKVRKLKSSREWLTAALNKYAAGQAIEMPHAARLLL